MMCWGRIAGAALLSAILFAQPAWADNVDIQAVLSPTEQIKLDFQDGSKHFVLLVKREGKAEGSGPLAGAAVTEYGMHDIIPGVSGDPRGYLEVTAPSGDIAYLKWQVRAVFLKGEGKPRLRDHGFWELAGGTGAFAGQRGVGTLEIKPAGKVERLFILKGEIAPAP